MQGKTIGNIVLAVGAGAVLAVVAAVALMRTGGPPPTYNKSIREFEELQRLLNEGKDSDAQRKAVLDGLKGLPDEPLSKALRCFAERNYAGVASAGLDPAVPFHRGLFGSALLQMGKRREAGEELKKALEEAPRGWDLQALFETTLRRASAP